MRIEGQFVFQGIPSEAVWNFLTDANRIAECLPGCEKLLKTGEGIYEMRMKIGIGPINGTFTGGIRVHDLKPTSEYRMSISGTGAPGFVKGEGGVVLSLSGDGTLLEYSGEVNAGGPIASLGQRMIGGAARMIIGQFFKCVAEKLRGSSATS